MTKKKPDNAFTIEPSRGIAYALTSGAGVFTYTTEDMPHSIEVFKAIWDTGATITAITPEVVRKCRLDPAGKTIVHGVNSDGIVNTYFVDLVLPGSIEIRRIKVSEASIANFDGILIGMDIITLGDFAVSNYQGTTSFTFRMPSLEAIDFRSTLR